MQVSPLQKLSGRSGELRTPFSGTALSGIEGQSAYGLTRAVRHFMIGAPVSLTPGRRRTSTDPIGIPRPNNKTAERRMVQRSAVCQPECNPEVLRNGHNDRVGRTADVITSQGNHVIDVRIARFDVGVDILGVSQLV